MAAAAACSSLATSIYFLASLEGCRDTRQKLVVGPENKEETDVNKDAKVGVVEAAREEELAGL